MDELLSLSDALKTLGGAELLAWLSIGGYAITWIMTRVPAPSRHSRRWWRQTYAILNALAGNVGRAKNQSG